MFESVHSVEALQTLAREKSKSNAVNLVLYEAGSVRNEFTRRILTQDVLVRFNTGIDAKRLALEAGVNEIHELPQFPGWTIIRSPEPGGALTLASQWRKQPGVLYAEPQLRRFHQKKFLPNDSWFSSQWHLRNTGQNGGTPGLDINIINAWDAWRGNGITIGIVDDGMQLAHPDLAPNMDFSLSKNFNSSTFNPAINTHGTPVAGIIGARGNNSIGVTGVAFEARLADLRLIADAQTDEQDAAAMLYRNDVISIKNNSWGAYDGDGRLDGPGPLMADALQQGTTIGRDGKGVVYTFAAGNGKAYGENANYDGYANSMHVISVGAINDQGVAASYSEPGACIAVVAPSRGSSSTCSGRPGITTTDLLGYDGRNPGSACDLWDRDYTSTFGGTSAATPIVSGVAALILQANSSLTWRDVKEIMMRSASKVAVADPDWQTNRAGQAHHHQYGAGLVNASAALTIATQWLNLAPMDIITIPVTNINRSIPDNSPAGISVTFTVTNQGFRVEHATLAVTLPHPRFGDLAINLTSPWGMTSRLTESHSSTGTGFDGWILTSVRHWGEPAAGSWTVSLADLAAGNVGTLHGLQLTLFGSMPKAQLTTLMNDGNLCFTLRAPALGWRYVLEASTNLVHWADVATLVPGWDGKASYTTSATGTTPQFFRARHVP